MTSAPPYTMLPLSLAVLVLALLDVSFAAVAAEHRRSPLGSLPVRQYLESVETGLPVNNTTSEAAIATVAVSQDQQCVFLYIQEGPGRV